MSKRYIIEIEGDDLINFCQSNYEPEEVFDVKELEYWAESNGYVKEEA
jgi:hypothetical protein